jgi:hypothetical protein
MSIGRVVLALALSIRIAEAQKPTPAPTPTPTPTPSPAVEVISNLLKPAAKGDTKIETDKEDQFVIGQTVVIDPGVKNSKGVSIEETGKIVGRGTLVLKDKLKHAHKVTAVVKGIASATTTPKVIQTTTPAATLTTTPAAKFAGDEQQRVAGVPNLLLIVGLFVTGAIIALVFRARAARKSRQSRELSIPFGSDSEDGPLLE